MYRIWLHTERRSIVNYRIYCMVAFDFISANALVLHLHISFNLSLEREAEEWRWINGNLLKILIKWNTKYITRISFQQWIPLIAAIFSLYEYLMWTNDDHKSHWILYWTIDFDDYSQTILAIIICAVLYLIVSIISFVYLHGKKSLSVLWTFGCKENASNWFDWNHCSNCIDNSCWVMNDFTGIIIILAEWYCVEYT